MLFVLGMIPPKLMKIVMLLFLFFGQVSNSMEQGIVTDEFEQFKGTR